MEVLLDLKSIEKYSFSKLNSFHGCKYGYKLTYHDKKRGEENGFSQLGSFVHGILEDYLNEEILQFEMVSKFEEGFQENVPNGISSTTFSNKTQKTFVKDLTDSYKAQCVSFLDKFDGFHDHSVLGVEEKFEILVKINDKMLILNGFIDVIIQDENGEIVIVDYKSKSAFKNKEEIRHYARQLYMYSIWIKHKYGKYPKELRFVQFRIDHEEKIPFNMEDFNETLDWIYKTSMEIEDEQFFEPSCDVFFAMNLCGHREYCDYNCMKGV